MQNASKGEIEIGVHCETLEPAKISQAFVRLKAMDNNDQHINEETTKQIMDKYRSEKHNTNKIMAELPDAQKYLPLHLFNENMIHDKIKQWILNDMDYKMHLLEVIKLFTKHSLSGQVINLTSITNCKKIIFEDLTRFMEEQTIDIMFEELDKYREHNRNKVQSMAAPQIAYLIFNYPIQRLLQKILNDKIDGQVFINRFQDRDKWIKNETGWSNDNVYQIEAILFRNLSMTKHEFITNMNRIMNLKKSISNPMKLQIRNKIMEFDAEKISYRIKNNLPIPSFSDAIIALADDLDIINEGYKQNNDGNAYYGDDFIPKIYILIASIFIYQNPNGDEFAIERKRWICCNCNSSNNSRFINRAQQHDISICSVCGIEQIQSTILKLRNYDTFTMIENKDDDELNCDPKNDAMADSIDSMIRMIMNKKEFDLKCPSQNNNQPCKAIIRLTRMLIIYKRWLQGIDKKSTGKRNIDNTEKVDLKDNIDNNTYKQVLIEVIASLQHKRLTDKMRQSLLNMVNKNKGNISDIATFLNAESKKEYASLFKQYANVKPLWGYKIYAQVNNKLKRIAQTKQYGEFINNLEMNQIDIDYYHILKIHINQGNRNTIKNTFKYFSTIIHHEDSSKEASECISIERRKERVYRLGNTSKSIGKLQSNDNMNHKEDKQLWNLQQTYNQSQLDLIHSYLCHTDWKDRVNRYIQQKKDQKNEGKDDEKEDYELEEVDAITTIHTENKSKYVTTSYGFGVDHRFVNDYYILPYPP